MTDPGVNHVDLRPYKDSDHAGVVELLRTSLNVPSQLAPDLFRWKHLDNPFGPSPAWVAVDGDRVVAFRPFLRWEFERAGQVVKAVRAVDTATHQDYRGRGLFRRLTEEALPQLAAEGVAFVFNTPNDQSRPGYLKMGWRVVGVLPVLGRPRSPASLLKLVQARQPAALGSTVSTAGIDATEVLGEPERLAGLVAQPSGGLRTRRSAAYLTWRYGFRPLAYRAMPSDAGVDAGAAFFRLRRRGPALEAAICDVLFPTGDGRARAALLRKVVRRSKADYGVRLGTDDLPRAHFVRVPRQGPTLTWRALADPTMPDLADWALALGDIELM